MGDEFGGVVANDDKAIRPRDEAPLPVHGEESSLREQQEIQAAIISAKRFPRDENQAYARIIRSFEKKEVAEDALYSFKRAGTSVKGPSVATARELARCWGNIKHGVRILSVTDEFVHLKGFAIDVETNTTAEADDRFKKLVQRKNYQTNQTEWREPDERDLRELISKRGAIALRNAILQLIPRDVVEAATSKAEETMRRSASGELKVTRDEVIRTLALAFDSIGVSVPILEAKLGHPLKLLNEEELVELRQIHRSIKDGNTKRQDHFELMTGAEQPTSGGSSDLMARVQKQLPGAGRAPGSVEEAEIVEERKR